MLKFGVFDKDLFLRGPSRGVWSRLHYRFSRSRVSMHLLEMPARPSRDDAVLFEKLMPFIQLSSGTYRTTYRDRFRELDPVVNGLLTKIFSSQSKLHVEDWAASACLTSREWADTLFPLFPDLHFVASDVLLFLIEVDGRGAGEKLIFEPHGQPLQYIRPPFVIPMQRVDGWTFPLNRLLYLHGRRWWQELRSASGELSDSWLDSLAQGSIEVDGHTFRKLSLIHPEALQLALTDKRFTICRQSVFERSTRACHVIRTMNILNRAYFSEQQLTQGARSVIDSLGPGGIWILGRTVSDTPSVHEVTILQKRSAGALDVLQRIGPGSEIESIALAAAA